MIIAIGNSTRRYVGEVAGLFRRGVTALEQIAGALEVMQLVFVELAEMAQAEQAELDERSEEGCDCAQLCSMGPTCPGGMLARLPGSGCARTL